MRVSAILRRGGVAACAGLAILAGCGSPAPPPPANVAPHNSARNPLTSSETEVTPPQVGHTRPLYNGRSSTTIKNSLTGDLARSYYAGTTDTCPKGSTGLPETIPPSSISANSSAKYCAYRKGTARGAYTSFGYKIGNGPYYLHGDVAVPYMALNTASCKITQGSTASSAVDAYAPFGCSVDFADAGIPTAEQTMLVDPAPVFKVFAAKEISGTQAFTEINNYCGDSPVKKGGKCSYKILSQQPFAPEETDRTPAPHWELAQGNIESNCGGKTDLKYELQIKHRVTNTTSYGGTLNAGVSKVIQAGLSANYQHSTTEFNEISETHSQVIPPGHRGSFWIQAGYIAATADWFIAPTKDTLYSVKDFTVYLPLSKAVDNPKYDPKAPKELTTSMRMIAPKVMNSVQETCSSQTQGRTSLPPDAPVPPHSRVVGREPG